MGTAIRRTFMWPVAAYLLLAGAAYLATLLLNSGVFVYSLDDPYIHITLARNIWGGHYGINAGEYSAPSSSVAWPFLLAPFSATRWLEAAPLLMNLVCAVSLLVFLCSVLERDIGVADRLTLALLGCTAIVLFNLVGLTFTGMEHGLQVLLSTLISVGVIRLLMEDRLHWWLCAALALAPLVRYECLALTVPSVLVLYLVGRRRAEALTITMFLALTLGGFSAYLTSLHLEALPSSVMAKSAIVSQASTGQVDSAVTQIPRNLIWNFSCLSGLLMSVLVVAAVVGLCRRAAPATAWLLLWLISAFTLHMLFGRHGGYERYELYMVVPCTLIALYAWRDLFSGSEAKTHRGVQFLVLATLALLSVRYIRATLFTPLASNNIFQQQYQMARFARDFLRTPLAVNDLGLVADMNPSTYVLDLAGLASSQALRANRSDARWITRLTEQHHVRYAILYEEWFPKLPCDWVKAGEMQLGHIKVTPAYSKVVFYAIGQSAAQTLRTQLSRFAPTLPTGVKLRQAAATEPADFHERCAALGQSAY